MFATSKIDLIVSILHKIYWMQRILIHIKKMTLLKMATCSQSMQRTWWPVASTTIVTGSYWGKLWLYLVSPGNVRNCPLSSGGICSSGMIQSCYYKDGPWRSLLSGRRGKGSVLLIYMLIVAHRNNLLWFLKETCDHTISAGLSGMSIAAAE